MYCSCGDSACTRDERTDPHVERHCPFCGTYNLAERHVLLELCFRCDVWATIEDIINEAEDHDLGPMAIVGRLIEARDRLFPVGTSS